MGGSVKDETIGVVLFSMCTLCCEPGIMLLMLVYSQSLHSLFDR